MSIPSRAHPPFPALLATLLAVLATLSPAPALAGAAPRTQILYASTGKLFAISPDGGNRRLVARIPRGTTDISASASGRRFCLIVNEPAGIGERGSTRTIYLLALGQGLRKVTTMRAVGPVAIALSPRGDTLAFVRGREIWTIQPDGTGLRRATSGPGLATEPTFTAAGDELVFVRSSLPNAEDGLYRASVRGGNETRIASGEPREPAISRHGLVVYRDHPGEREALMATRLGWALARFKDPFADGGPAFSPNGRRVAFMAFHEGAAAGLRFSIEVVDSRGSHRSVASRRTGPKPLGPLWTVVP